MPNTALFTPGADPTAAPDVSAARRQGVPWRENADSGSGGEPPGHVVDPTGPVERSTYASVFGDMDGDEIADIDDPQPMTPGVESIEEVQLSEEMGKLFEVREDFRDVTQDVVADLESLSSDAGVGQVAVKGRTKTPYSILNKLRRKRLRGEKGLTDIAATRVVVPDFEAAKRLRNRIMTGKLGEVLEYENHYDDPSGGYRAYHVIIERGDGYKVEVQVRTRRLSAISDAAHPHYKAGRLDEDEMLRLTTEAHKADQGDRAAARRIDSAIEEESGQPLSERLRTERENPPSESETAAIHDDRIFAKAYTAFQKEHPDRHEALFEEDPPSDLVQSFHEHYHDVLGDVQGAMEPGSAVPMDVGDEQTATEAEEEQSGAYPTPNSGDQKKDTVWGSVALVGGALGLAAYLANSSNDSSTPNSQKATP